MFDINNPAITDFADKFEQKWHGRNEIKEYLIKKAGAINIDCQEAAYQLSNSHYEKIS